MAELTCPLCRFVFTPSVTINDLTICPGCLRTLAVMTAPTPEVAVAVGEQTVNLTPAERDGLVKLRKRLRSEQGAAH